MLGGKANGNYNLEQISNNDFPVDYDAAGISNVILVDQNRKVSAVFGQYEVALGDFNLTAGARYEDYSDIGTHLSPRASLIYQINNTNSLKVLYGHAFRPPATGETGFENNVVLISNPDLKAELIDTFELNWVFQPATWWSQIGCYRSTVTDGIVLYTKPETGSTRYYRNSSEALVMSGCELEMIKPVTQHTELRLGGAQQFELDETYNNLSKNQVSASLSSHRNNWEFNLNYFYFGAIDYVTTDNVHHEAGAYGITGAKVSYHLSDNSSINFTGSNILNRQYNTPARTFAAGLPERDRQLSISFELTDF